MFTFDRIGWIDGDGKEASSWMLLIETDEHSRIQEQVFETRTLEDLVFPLPKDEVDEVKITNWPLCPHFYLSVNGKNIEVDGVAKWKTISGAEEARRKFERRRKAAKRRKK